MYCENCGAWNEDKAKFCCKCGSPLNNTHRKNFTNIERASTDNNYSEKMKEATFQSSKISKKVLLGAGAVLVVLIVLIGVIFNHRKTINFNDDGFYDSSTKQPMIALTFDDGPGEYTETLLDAVEKYNIHVTFFMIGENIKGRESTVQRMLKLGCEIGNHTWDHSPLPLTDMDLDSVVQEFQKTDDELVKACGQAATVCRASYGSITEEQIAAVGKPFFMWSTDSLDWKLMDADADYDQIMNDSTLGDGSIILMHDNLETSVKCATEKLIPALINQGYKLVTVSELAAAKDVTLQSISYTDFLNSSL